LLKSGASFLATQIVDLAFHVQKKKGEERNGHKSGKTQKKGALYTLGVRHCAGKKRWGKAATLPSL